jgi:hypothetical protein
MSKQIISIRDGLLRNMKDRLSIESPHLKGEVSIYEKLNGKLDLIKQKNNLIVYNGRTWLLRRAFGKSILESDTNEYNKTICWFGCGQGGGEPGNPLQAGATLGSDTKLLSQVRLRSNLVSTDPGYSWYASHPDTKEHGYFKKFSSVIIKEDHSNPYLENNITKYPPIIAEIRIELSSNDANGDGWTDLNEAALFISDPDIEDPGYTNVEGGYTIDSCDIKAIHKDGDYSIYILDTINLNESIPNLKIGDYMIVSDCIEENNNANNENRLLIVDKYNGQTGRNGYVVVENPIGIEEDPSTGISTFVKKSIHPYIMFSRCTFSSIRKTEDRELVFLWKIYF